MSKNINTNTNIAQIILSDQHEIRLKKKPKKKSSGAKKKALEDVKAALQQYDMAVAEAKSKNITLPAELGQLPVNIEDVNSIKELQQLAIKIQSMTSQINQLIAQGASQQRTIGLFQEGVGSQRAGVLPPVVQPQIIQPQQIIPQEKPISVRPIKPEIVDPSKKPTDNTNAEKTLEQIRQEILDKLSPEDRAKAEAEIEKEKEQEAKTQPMQPEEPSTPQAPSTPSQTPPLPDIKPPAEMKESDFEINRGIEFGKRRFDLKSPVGFYHLLTRYRRYVKNVLFFSTLINEGEYKIEKDKYRILETEKESILKDYYVWLRNLNLSQTNFMDSNAELLEINNEMVFDLNQPPEDLAQKLLKAQGVTIKEFKVGDEETKTEKILETKITEKGLDYKNRMNKQADVINEIIMKANKTVKPDELKDLENQLNLIRSDVGKYYQLDPIDKVGLEVKHAQLEDMLNEAFKEIEDKEQEIAKGLPVTPLQELKPSDPVAFKPPSPKPRKEAESQPPSPKAEGNTQQERDIDLLNKYVSSISFNYSKKVREALQRIPNSKSVYDANEKTRQRTFSKNTISQDIRKRVREFLIKENLFEDKKPKA